MAQVVECKIHGLIILQVQSILEKAKLRLEAENLGGQMPAVTQV